MTEESINSEQLVKRTRPLGIRRAAAREVTAGGARVCAGVALRGFVCPSQPLLSPGGPGDTEGMDKLTSRQILDAGLGDWRKLAQALHGRFLTGDFVTGLTFVTAVSEAAEAANHHPDVTLTYPFVDVKLVSHDVSQVTVRDIDLARQISEIAREQGIGTEPSAPTQLELALDTADLAAVGPFWATFLTGSPDSLRGDDVVDPSARVPLLWFQHTDAHETPRQRFHVDPVSY